MHGSRAVPRDRSGARHGQPLHADRSGARDGRLREARRVPARAGPEGRRSRPLRRRVPGVRGRQQHGLPGRDRDPGGDGAQRRALRLVQQPAGLHLSELHLLRRHAGADPEVRAQPARRQDHRHDVADRVGRRLRRRGQHEDLRPARRRRLPHQRPEDVGVDRQRDRRRRAVREDRPRRGRQGRDRLHRRAQEVPGLEGAADRHAWACPSRCAPTSSSSTTSSCRWKTAWARKARASRSSCAPCSRAAWAWPARRWASRARASRKPCATPTSARCAASRSAVSR